MTINRRGFFASLAALAVAPSIAPPVSQALLEVAATARRLQEQSDRLKEIRRLQLESDAELRYYAAFTAYLYAARGGKDLTA